MNKRTVYVHHSDTDDKNKIRLQAKDNTPVVNSVSYNFTNSINIIFRDMKS